MMYFSASRPKILTASLGSTAVSVASAYNLVVMEWKLGFGVTNDCTGPMSPKINAVETFMLQCTDL